MNLLSKITGRRHHFKVVVRYYPDPTNGMNNVERIINVWMPDRRDIADERGVKRLLAPNMFAEMPRRLKCNGILRIQSVYYLGWFKPWEKGNGTSS